MLIFSLELVRGRCRGVVSRPSSPFSLAPPCSDPHSTRLNHMRLVIALPTYWQLFTTHVARVLGSVMETRARLSFLSYATGAKVLKVAANFANHQRLRPPHDRPPVVLILEGGDDNNVWNFPLSLKFPAKGTKYNLVGRIYGQESPQHFTATLRFPDTTTIFQYNDLRG